MQADHGYRGRTQVIQRKALTLGEERVHPSMQKVSKETSV
jgi:hypothetical protein